MEYSHSEKMTPPLYSRHVALGAKIVDFSGWLMPLSYKGIIEEHLQVRKSVGLFDISHMGRILVSGPDAEVFLDYLSTNIIAGKPDFSATYTVWSKPLGGCVDDLIVYKEDREHYFVVVNAANREKDLIHLQNESQAFQVRIEECSGGIVAVQGREAVEVVTRIAPAFAKVAYLRPMAFCNVDFDGGPIVVATTGYTGAGGVEIYASKEQILFLWDRLLEVGAFKGIMPIGLGARDTLRLEMGYALYGHELNEEISANESVSFWTVKFDKRDFIGKEALEKIESSPEKRAEYGVILQEPGIARAGYLVFQEGVEIGVVTSGTFSPSLQQAIAIILVEKVLSVGDIVNVKIREELKTARVVKLPFLKSGDT